MFPKKEDCMAKGSGARDRGGGTLSKWQNCRDRRPGRESVLPPPPRQEREVLSPDEQRL